MAGQLHLPQHPWCHRVYRIVFWLAVIAAGIHLVLVLVNEVRIDERRKEFLAAAYRGDAATVRRWGGEDQLTIDEAFRKAAHDGNAETVGVLLAKGANVNARYERGETAIMVAGADGCHSREERQAIWRVLLQHGPDLSLRDDVGRTALHFASLFGDEPLVKALLKRKVTVDPRDRNGITPVQIAEQCGHSRVVSTLLAHGARPTNRDLGGKGAVR